MSTKFNVRLFSLSFDVYTDHERMLGIGEVEWLYQTSFSYEPDNEATRTVLEFEGLDTLCDVYLVRSHCCAIPCAYSPNLERQADFGCREPISHARRSYPFLFPRRDEHAVLALQVGVG